MHNYTYCGQGLNFYEILHYIQVVIMGETITKHDIITFFFFFFFERMGDGFGGVGGGGHHFVQYLCVQISCTKKTTIPINKKCRLKTKVSRTQNTLTHNSTSYQIYSAISIVHVPVFMPAALGKPISRSYLYNTSQYKISMPDCQTNQSIIWDSFFVCHHTCIGSIVSVFGLAVLRRPISRPDQ